VSAESGGPVVDRVVYRPTLVLSKRARGFGVEISTYRGDGSGSHLARSRHPSDVEDIIALVRAWLLEEES
jgi:hypothetical protein